MLLNFFLRFGAETIFLCLLVLAIFRWGSIGKLFEAFDPSTRFKVLVLLSLCFFAQCVDRLQYNFPPLFDLFPFARFAMYQYATVKDPVSAYRFEGIYNDETREHLNFTRAFSAIGLPAISSRFRVISEKFELSDDAGKIWAREQARLYLSSLMKLRQADGLRIPDSFELLLLTKAIAAPTTSPADRKVLLTLKREEL
jgi:hypothetical protein